MFENCPSDGYYYVDENSDFYNRCGAQIVTGQWSEILTPGCQVRKEIKESCSTVDKIWNYR